LNQIEIESPVITIILFQLDWWGKSIQSIKSFLPDLSASDVAGVAGVAAAVAGVAAVPVTVFLITRRIRIINSFWRRIDSIGYH